VPSDVCREIYYTNQTAVYGSSSTKLFRLESGLNYENVHNLSLELVLMLVQFNVVRGV